MNDFVSRAMLFLKCDGWSFVLRQEKLRVVLWVSHHVTQVGHGLGWWEPVLIGELNVKMAHPQDHRLGDSL